MIASSRASMAGRNETVVLLLGFAALVAVGVASAWLVARSAGFNDAVARTLETKTEIVRALSIAQDAETGQRGFLLTDDERYLEPYVAALSEVDASRARLETLIVGPSEQGTRRVALKAALEARLNVIGETVKLQREGRTADVRAVIDSERGRRAMLEIRRIVAEMTAHEDRIISERSEQAQRSSHALLVVVVLGLLIAAGLAYAAQTIVRRRTAEAEEARAALAEANDGLEEAVNERTADLVSANEEIQRFAYIVSHDLRAPLVNVMGFTSELDAARKVLKDQIDGLDEVGAAKVTPEARAAIEEDLPEAIGFIRTSTAKMDRLINAILRLSREGRRDMRPESVEIAAIIGVIADTMRQQTQGANAEIEIQPDLPAIVTDRLSIEQIFQNLVENAVKYLDASRPGRISVTGRRVGPQVEYAIEDNGRGIDPKDHERVFELFRRAGRQDQPGEGLGLAFVRASVRRLGGVIRLTSEPGRGSTFHLTFPAVYRPPSESRAA